MTFDTRRPHLAALVIAVLALSAACGGESRRLPPGTSNPDKFLYDRGIAAINDKKWLTAREYFRQIVDGYPQSPLRADAKLGVADTYLGEGTTEGYIAAINEYREFLNFFPTHPRADYAQYKLAMGHFHQMRAPERDQTETKAAILEFEAFVERFPNSSLMGEVRAKMREARDRMSESNYRVGVFYFRLRHYPGAIDRFREILKTDPEYTHRDGVYFYLAESLMKVNLAAEALPYYERLLDEFQQSEYLEEAQKRVTQLKSGTTTSKS
jgi:outer membrane protein assembly factor BamD